MSRFSRISCPCQRGRLPRPPHRRRLGGRPPPTAVSALQGYVSRIRRLLSADGGRNGGALETRSGGYLLRLAEGAVDAQRFERLVAVGRQALASGDAAGGRSKLGAALGLWRGPALCDFTFEEFAQGAIARLEELRLVAVGSRPVAVTVGHGSLWVANADDGTLSRVDPERAEVIRTIGIAAPVVDLAAAPGAVWTANGSDGTLSKVDPATHTVVATIDLGGSNPLAPDSVSTVGWGAGRLWVGHGTRGLAQIDGGDAPAVTPIAMTNPTVAVTYGASAVGAATVDGRVHRIEPRTGAITTETPVGHPLDLTFGEGAVWLADAQGRVWRLDMETGAVSYVASVGASPVGIHAGGGAVWVACNGDSAIVRLDPDTCAVVARTDLGAPPTDVILMDGVLWASVQHDRLC